MTTSSNKQESTQATSQDNQETNSGYSKEPEATEEKENFGYEMDSEESEDKKPEENNTEKDDDSEKKSEEDDKKVENRATGYGEDDSEENEQDDKEKSKDDKPEDDKDKKEEDESEEIVKLVEGLPEGYDKDKTAKFAKEHKLSKDQVKAYVEFMKEDVEQLNKAREQRLKETRKAWESELKQDPDFGGENFDKNVDRVEKLLENHMVNTKQVIKNRGSKMPPYMMKDLLAIAKELNPTTKLVGGEPTVKKKDDKGNFLEDLYQ